MLLLSISPQPIRVQRGPCPASEREKGKREKRRGERGRGGGADIEGRLGTQGDFCSLKQLLEETSLLFCFLLTPFLLFVLAKDMYKNVF